MSHRLFLTLLTMLLVAGMAQSAEPAAASHDEDASQTKALSEGRRLMDSGKPGEAITNAFDQVIAYFDAKYRGSTNRIYCAQNSTESLAYLLAAAADNQSAVVIGSGWAEAYFMKGFALMDLRRPSEGKKCLERAVAISTQPAIPL